MNYCNHGKKLFIIILNQVKNTFVVARINKICKFYNDYFLGVFYFEEDLDRNSFEVEKLIVSQLPSASKKMNILNQDSYENQAKNIYTSLKNLHNDSEINWPHIQVCCINK